MRVQLIKAQHNGTCARPASGSAFLAGHVVTVTVPTLSTSNGLPEIGNEWTELRFTSEDDQPRPLVIVAANATEI